MTTTRERLASLLDRLPDKPGCYLFRDRRGVIVYVGKARSLRKRVRSYFRPSALRQATPKLRSLIRSVADIETLVVRNEAEALLTEGRLIKENRPRYNISFRDDKQFLHLRIDLSEPFPKLEVCRARKRDGARYFGPYASAPAARATVDFIEKRLGLRKCAPSLPDERTHRHCINDIVRYCLAPCIGSCDAALYRERVEEACRFLAGHRPGYLSELDERMREAARTLDFESAAALRDALNALRATVRQRARVVMSATLQQEQTREGLREIRDLLHLSAPPHAIEGFDISNISGEYAVASMVRFEDGKPCRARYRRYRIRSVVGSDDPAMMAETIRRRYDAPDRKTPPPPDLVLVDGGQTQMRAAVRELRKLGLERLPVAGLAKRNEKLHLPGAAHPLRADPNSPALKILRSLRDEAHRFALDYHRTLRSRAMGASVLDTVPGIGPQRKRQLLETFGSVRRLAQASLEEVAAVRGIGPRQAAALHRHLSPDSP
jgi:excinuclease ABC subunit C